MKTKKFELGKFYSHPNGNASIHICGLANPIMYSMGFVAETPGAEYHIVGTKEDNATGWIEISKEEFLKNCKEMI